MSDNSLGSSVADLTREVRGFRKLVLVVLVVGLPMLAVAGALAVVGWATAGDAESAADEAQDAVDQINASRAEARVASCHQDNVQIQRNNNGWFVLVEIASRDDETTAEGQAVIDEFLMRVITPERDCTAEGIDEYLSTTVPVSPATNAPAVPTEP